MEEDLFLRYQCFLVWTLVFNVYKAELGQLMETLGIRASQDEIDLMISEIDRNGDGDIQFEGWFQHLSGVFSFFFFAEFVAVMSRKVNATYTAGRSEFRFSIKFFLFESVFDSLSFFRRSQICVSAF